MKVKNIPNILSCIRIALVVVFVVCFIFCYNPYLITGIFLLAGITDVIDGYLARKNNWVSDLGKILDPLADKLMQCAVLICLIIFGMIPIWFAAPYILKELLMLSGGLFMLKKRSIVVVSNIFGKMAVVFFYIVICLVMLLTSPTQAEIPLWVNVSCGISLGFTVFALTFYIIQYRVLRPKDPNIEMKDSGKN